ncbi:hypothetical protein DFQ30_002700, partial [Apophysomyces sp. BC1015]
ERADHQQSCDGQQCVDEGREPNGRRRRVAFEHDPDWQDHERGGGGAIQAEEHRLVALDVEFAKPDRVRPCDDRREDAKRHDVDQAVEPFSLQAGGAAGPGYEAVESVADERRDEKHAEQPEATGSRKEHQRQAGAQRTERDQIGEAEERRFMLNGGFQFECPFVFFERPILIILIRQLARGPDHAFLTDADEHAEIPLAAAAECRARRYREPVRFQCGLPVYCAVAGDAGKQEQPAVWHFARQARNFAEQRREGLRAGADGVDAAHEFLDETVRIREGIELGFRQVCDEVGRPQHVTESKAGQAEILRERMDGNYVVEAVERVLVRRVAVVRIGSSRGPTNWRDCCRTHLAGSRRWLTTRRSSRWLIIWSPSGITSSRHCIIEMASKASAHSSRSAKHSTNDSRAHALHARRMPLNEHGRTPADAVGRVLAEPFVCSTTSSRNTISARCGVKRSMLK